MLKHFAQFNLLINCGTAKSFARPSLDAILASQLQLKFVNVRLYQSHTHTLTHSCLLSHVLYVPAAWLLVISHTRLSFNSDPLAADPCWH